MLKMQSSMQLQNSSTTTTTVMGLENIESEIKSLEESIEGLRYFPDFLSEKQSLDLLNEIDERNEWESEINSRRTLQYGYHFNYLHGGGLRKLQEEIPNYLKPVMERIEQLEDGSCWHYPQISQIILNEYKGLETYISKHIDSLDFGPTVAIISLGDPCLIVLHERTPKDPNATWNANEIIPIQNLQATGKKMCLVLKPGSLLVLNGKARYLWQHEIPKQCLWKKYLGESWKTLAFGSEDFDENKFRRVSLTMRSVVVQVP
ncbi:predicted protein [Naegleria gruberi]|uniref:Predicted protein n=1 Tax=Naegleria gruberi TaxID=5762 RepID=D2VQ84_NAEGR|nr:uncharacterized protein NAEGRDRAFT_51356 [Naegleria gruberi]EFC41064.1 predicted protein [Naegleria gruberi]|eukprot:XP_002673808.1 predicted protein [Naegleria gruberi strain NEG-M]